MPGTDLESLAVELLALPPEEFTTARSSKSRHLKAAGRADLAAQVSALRRPSLSLWAVNRLAADPGILQAVHQAAQTLLKAQTGGSAEQLRKTSEQFERELERAGAAAAELLRQSGHAASEDAVRRAREIVRIAAVRGDETWHRLANGALAAEPEPFDAFGMFAAQAPPRARPHDQRSQAAARQELKRAERKARDDAERAERASATARRLRQEAAELAAAAERAAERASEAEHEAARAREQADDSLHVVEQLR